MRKPIFAAVCLLLICSTVVGQDVAELAIMRSLLGMPTNTPVSTSSSAAAPKDSPLVVYVEVTGDKSERDKKIRESLVQWLDEWGKGPSAKGKAFEIVSDSEKARVGLIQFTDFPTEILAARGEGSFSSTIRMSMVVYTYIIIKEPKSLTIVYRHKDPILSRSTIVPGDHLTSAITARLKKDIEKEIDKRALKPSNEKDAKRPDYKLRDEFVRWLSSEVNVMKHP